MTAITWPTPILFQFCKSRWRKPSSAAFSSAVQTSSPASTLCHGDLTGAAGAIVTFDRNTETGVGDAGAMHAFGTALHEDARHGLHQQGVEVASSRHHEGMGADRRDDAMARLETRRA